jgi:glutathione-regulated potassium-efflux system ancillary protein KefG
MAHARRDAETSEPGGSRPPARRVLVLFAHPAFQHSLVHRRLVPAVRSLSGVTFHDLYEAYPDFDVDVKREQALLSEHDVYVLEHPFFWYGVPPLVKQWMDLVLEHGWAFGRGGNALEGKLMFSALSTGGSEQNYAHDARDQLSIREFLAPIEHSMRFCGIEYLPPFVVHGTFSIRDTELARAAADYASIVAALRDGRLDLDAARKAARLTAALVRAPVS